MHWHNGGGGSECTGRPTAVRSEGSWAKGVALRPAAQRAHLLRSSTLRVQLGPKCNYYGPLLLGDRVGRPARKGPARITEPPVTCCAAPGVNAATREMLVR